MTTRTFLAIAATVGALWSVQPHAEATLPLTPKGWVNDFAGVLDPGAANRLETLLADLQRRTGAEVAVVTVRTVPEGDIDRAAVELFHAWGIGKKGQDSGVLILCAIENHRIRIEVGYGLEAVLPDALCGRIIREEIVPFFKAGNFSGGLTAGTVTLARLVAQHAGITLNDAGLDMPSLPPTPAFPWFIILAIDFLILLFVVFSFMFFQRRGGLPRWSFRSGWGSGTSDFSSGAFSGGFGGFGGGMSGGGGASGSW